MRALRMIYEDSYFFNGHSLGKNMSFSVYNRNIQQLALEIYKVTKGLAPAAILSLFL